MQSIKYTTSPFLPCYPYTSRPSLIWSVRPLFMQTAICMEARVSSSGCHAL